MIELNEKFFNKKLSNGLSVTVIQKKDFKTVSASFTTKFGGAYQKVKVDNEIITLPTGVAHFLEHKLFASADGEDITYQFENIGLEVNAYTDYFNTTYYFSGSGNVYQGIELLLNFVQSPHFTTENVESEKGIIEQELLMYQDMPDEALSLGLMKNLFHKYPYIYDVGGTVDDVYKIDKDILNFCYHTFYHPLNMNFVIVGDVDPNEVFNFIENNQKNKSFTPYKNPSLVIDEEGNDVVKEFDSKEMDVVNQKVAIGFKMPPRKDSTTRNQLFIEELYYRIIKNILFGGDTPFVQKLLDNKMIFSSLASNYSGDDYVQFFTFTAETNQPYELAKIIQKRFKDLKQIKFSQNKLTRIKKDLIGKYIIGFNSISNIMGEYLEFLATNCDYLDYIKIVNSITVEELREKSKMLLDLPMTIYVIKPNRK